MSRRLVMCSLLLVCVAGALAGWLFGGIGDAPLQDWPGTAASVPAIAANPAPSSVATPEGAAGLQRAEVVAGPRFPIPADAEWVTVHVLDGETGAPIEGAEVVWLFAPYGVLPWEILRRMSPDAAERLMNDREAAPREYGSSARSDADGLVKVAVRPDGVRLFARGVARYGTLHLHAGGLPPPGGHRLLLWPERELRVAVVDAAGQPAIGVPVRMVRDGAPEPINGSPIRYECARTAAPDGIARLAHLQERIGAPSGLSKKGWHVRVELPFLTEVAAPFDPVAPPAKPVELRLPPTGRVLARTTFEGRRDDHRDTVLLFPDDPQALRNEQRAAWRTAEPDGWVCFRHVPLGQHFVARASLVGWVEQAFAGPTAAGETVRVEIAPRDGLIAMTGRLVDAAGAPLANAVGYVNQEWSGGASGGHELSTDGDGRFRYIALLATPAKDGAVEFSQLDFVVERPKAPPLCAKLGPRTLSKGATEVGDVVMAPGPVLVAGRLQFSSGVRPFPVGFELQHEVAAEGSPSLMVWNDVPNRDAWQGDDGQFVVNGEALPGRWRLEVHIRGMGLGAAVPFQAGQQDLVVPVVVGEELWATVRLPANLPLGLRGVLRPATEPATSIHASATRDAWPQPLDGTHHALQWRGLKAGRYTCELRLVGFEAPLLSIPEVVVPCPPGGDPRLLDLDLRTSVQAVTVRVLGAEPEQLGELRVCRRHGSHLMDGYFQGFAAIEGVVRFPAPTRPVDLLLQCKGFQSVALLAVQGETTVTLQRWPELQVSLPDLPPLPKGVSLLAQLRPDPSLPGDGELQPPGDSLVVDGRVTLPCGPGPQVLGLLLRIGSEKRSFHLPLPTPIPPIGGFVEVRVAGPTFQRELDALMKAFGR